jgi:hypothetical protein
MFDMKFFKTYLFFMKYFTSPMRVVCMNKHQNILTDKRYSADHFNKFNEESYLNPDSIDYDPHTFLLSAYVLDECLPAFDLECKLDPDVILRHMTPCRPNWLA